MSGAKRNESKRDKFVRLAEKRMDSVLKGIELIGNLSNSSNYEYNQEDFLKIVKTLKGAISDLEHKFNKTNKTEKFKL